MQSIEPLISPEINPFYYIDEIQDKGLKAKYEGVKTKWMNQYNVEKGQEFDLYARHNSLKSIIGIVVIVAATALAFIIASPVYPAVAAIILVAAGTGVLSTTLFFSIQNFRNSLLNPQVEEEFSNDFFMKHNQEIEKDKAAIRVEEYRKERERREEREDARFTKFLGSLSPEQFDEYCR